MHILALSSSSSVQTVAVAIDGVVRAELAQTFARRAPRRVLRDMAAVLAEADVAWSALDLLAADVGPGSFTGIRAGLATVRALSYANNLPCFGMNALEIMSLSLPASATPRWFVLPSRSSTCFLARQAADGQMHAPVEAAFAALETHLPPGAAVFAPSQTCDAIEAAWPGRVILVGHDGPRARDLALAAAARFGAAEMTTEAATARTGAGESGWAALKPLYVSATDAERNTGVYVHASAIPAIARSS